MESRFVSLTPYCLVEYMFEPLGSLNYMTDDVVLLTNTETGLLQIINTDASVTTTRNIQDMSVVSIGNNKFAYADSEIIPNYIDFDSNITETPITGYNVVYDQVRFHFATGFDFEGFAGLILSIKNEMNNTRSHVFSNILFSPETTAELLTFNPKPLFITNSTYDRYIDIKVPSIKNINEEYTTSLSPSTTFAAAITPQTTGGSHGFITNAPIEITLSECGKKEKLDTNVGVKYDVFEVSDSYTSILSQDNEFNGVGAYVAESTSGDYLEYYMTFNSGFPEDLISTLNSRNPSNDWIIVHQLSIFEQVGSGFINTSRQVIFQEDNYDEPLLFRPILQNADLAVSMSVDLICRLTNRLNGEQIIREASFTLLSPKKYGKNLINIPLASEPQSQKIYNKLIQKNFESTKLFIEPTFAPGFESEITPESLEPIKSTEYVPVYFSNNNISISNVSKMAKKRDLADEVIFKPGQLRFILSPFDNTIKLKVYDVIDQKATPLDLNSNAAKYNLVFDTDNGKVSIPNANSDKAESLASGVISFNVSKNESKNILSSKNKTVYITSVAQDDSESLLYTGQWRKATEQADVDAAISAAKEEAEERQKLEQKLADYEAKLARLEQQNEIEKKKKSRSYFLKKRGVASVVNRRFSRKPRTIKTNTSNS